LGSLAGHGRIVEVPMLDSVQRTSASGCCLTIVLHALFAVSGVDDSYRELPAILSPGGDHIERISVAACVDARLFAADRPLRRRLRTIAAHLHRNLAEVAAVQLEHEPGRVELRLISRRAQ